MKIISVKDSAFKKYGEIIEGFDCSHLIEKLNTTTEKPSNKVIYVPEEESFMNLDIHKDFRDHVYGGMEIQIGYCNGHNKKLNCLEYHRGSEVNVAADDVVLLLGSLQDVDDNYQLDTKKIQAFLVPAGTAVLVYETTLHYAPCTYAGEDGFRVIIVLPKGTNTDKPDIAIKTKEDKLLWARNKWLIAHKDASEALAGAFVGLIGENITLD